MREALVAILLVVAAGCGQKTDVAQAPSPAPADRAVAPETTPPQATADQAAPGQSNEQGASAAQVRALVKIVALDGTPIEGMEPIATTKPNAFDAPVATGPATDKDGRSYLMMPGDRWLYVRAWDRSGGLFANNFFDIPPGEGNQTGEMEIVMVHGTKLKAKLVRADGAPADGENVGLMLFHPTQGPWWPGEADTDENGVADFGTVPAGKFALKIKAIRSGQVELPETFFPPGETLDLGTVTLK